MNKNETNEIIEMFMHPTVFTGVKPLFLVAEELATKKHMGDIIDAVWVSWNDEMGKEFSYITKFAVKGQILDRDFYTTEEWKPFKGRLALPNTDNFEKMIKHSAIKKELEEVKVLRNALRDGVKKNFDKLRESVTQSDEVFLFKKGYGDWMDPFFDINIESPYQIVENLEDTLAEGKYRLKHPKTGVIKTYVVENEFNAYIIAGKADIAGLQLKDESYKTKIEELKDKARLVFISIQWLHLSDPRVKEIKENLPNHPFEDYFNYVEKGKEKKVLAPEHLVQALIGMIEMYMPKLKDPMGIKYIPIDNLLHLFHEVIPRAEAQLALEVCDVIYQRPALILGIEGQRETAPKFLVSVEQVAFVYQQFSGFIEACESFSNTQ